MPDNARLSTTQRRLLVVLIAVSALQALLWGVLGVGDYVLLRVVLTVAFIGSGLGCVFALLRDSRRRRAR